MYRLITIIKGIRRRFLVDRAEYKAYGGEVGGWHGWYEFNGECIAFRDIDGKLSFNW